MRVEKGDWRTRVERMILFAERERFSIITGFIFLLLLILLRAWLEASIFEYHAVNLYFYSWQLAFFLSAFMGAVLVILLFTDLSFRKANNLALLAFGVTLLPPLVDLAMGRGGFENAELYSYATKETISELVFPFKGGTHHSWGLILQGWYIGIALLLYLWVKTRSFFKSILGVLCLGMVQFTLFARPFIFRMSAFSTGTGGSEHYVSLFSYFKFPLTSYSSYYAWVSDQSYISSLVYQQTVVSFIALHLLLFCVFFVIALYAANRNIFRCFVKSIRKPHKLHFAVMGIIGILAVRLVDPHFQEGLALNPLYILHLPYVILVALTVVFGFQALSMYNDIHNFESDKKARPDSAIASGDIAKEDYRQLAIMFGLLSLCTAFVLGWMTFLLVILCFLVGYVYSAPPFRLKCNPIAGSALLGLGSTLAYLIGVYSPTSWEIVYWDQYGYEEALTVIRTPPLFSAILVVGLVIMLVVFTASFLSRLGKVNRS